MESINEFGRSAAEIAQIIAKMDNNVCDESVIDSQHSRKVETRKRMQEIEAQIEEEIINRGEYEMHGIGLTKAPTPSSPNSIKYAREGGNKGWTESNGYYFANKNS